MNCAEGHYGATAGLPHCTRCSVGYFSKSGASACSGCAQGYHASSRGLSACTSCLPGYYAAALGAITCTSCQAGYSSFASSSACTACAAGTFSLAGSSSCAFCNSGKFSRTRASPSCELCSSGRYTPLTGTYASCSACQKGSSAPVNGSSSCTLCVAGRYADSTGTSTCTPCMAGYYCSAGSIRKDQHDCANETQHKPAELYCPTGSAHPLRVPRNYYTTPGTPDFLHNRQGISHCPQTSFCIDGLQTNDFFWASGDCRDGSDYTHTLASTSLSVDEATNGLPVGRIQRVHSPHSVEFTLDANGGPFRLAFNDSQAQIFVDQVGGLNFESVNSYFLQLTAFSNSSHINCSFEIAVTNVNEPPFLVLGTTRNVSQNAAVNEYLHGPAVYAIDPDFDQEQSYSIVHSSPITGLDYFGIGGCSGRLYVKALGLDVNIQQEFNLTIHTTE